MIDQNPKMIGTNIIDCIPQTGECPIQCEECFYNSGRFYRTLDTPLIPSLEESKGKIVRVNSGHDSNLQFDKVMNATKNYPDKFYNTSIEKMRFEAPVVLTLNRSTDNYFIRKDDVEGDISEIMFVRVRINIWNTIDMGLGAIVEWHKDFPVVLTDMRYYSNRKIRDNQADEYYEFRKHILNSYWMLNRKGYDKIFALLHFPNVYWCGNPFSLSTLCADCRLCEHLYIQAKMRLMK